jgi:hypothetical protein
MPLPREHLLDELATAYVQTIAASAGATIAVSRDYGVDGTLKEIVQSGDQFIESGFPVDFQLKGTTTATIDQDVIVYDLRVRNYNLLVERNQLGAPYYLFLVCFGPEIDQWVVESPERLILSASAYWWMESGVASRNSSTVRVKIPRAQRLNVMSLRHILESSKNRFSP